MKIEEVVKTNLGERLEEMVHLDLLATSPMSQGKGYGFALVSAVTSTADLQNRSTYLLSSNIQNTTFYNSCGFTTIANVVLGSSNPSWKAPPVIMPLMVRKPSKTMGSELGFVDCSSNLVR